MSNTFDINRFVSLIRQNTLHSYKMYMITLGGFFGGMFLLLFLIHMSHDFYEMAENGRKTVFILFYAGLGVVYAGSAFPGFRVKERAINYLMNPASRLEKFLLEYGTRIVGYLILFPIAFWIIYNVESYLVSVIYGKFVYQYQALVYIPELRLPEEGRAWIYVLVVSGSFFLMHVPFTGASIFSRYPLIKTLFGAGMIFLFNLLLVYIVVEKLGMKHYNISSEQNLLLIPTEGKDAPRFFAIISLVANGLLIAVSWFKLKEKEA